MKKIILFIVLFIATFHLYGQKAVEGMYVTNDNDTIRTSVLYKSMLNDINPMSFQGRIYIVNEDKKTVVKESDIKYLELAFKEKRVFVSNLLVHELKMKNRLYERLTTGKLNWYRSYYFDSYNQTVERVDHFFFKGQAPKGSGVFGNIKKTLKELVIESRPDLLPLINDMKTGTVIDKYRGIAEIIMSFNQN